jgi:hypothetical protein
MLKTGDIVYQKKRGWSGVPMRILELNQVNTPNGEITQALCRGAKGFGVSGLYSERYRAYVRRFAISNLTKEPNSAFRE